MVTVNEPESVQSMRLADVLVVGPLLIYAARHVRTPWLAGALAVTGVATIFYNGARYREIQRDLARP